MFNNKKDKTTRIMYINPEAFFGDFAEFFYDTFLKKDKDKDIDDDNENTNTINHLDKNDELFKEIYQTK